MAAGIPDHRIRWISPNFDSLRTHRAGDAQAGDDRRAGFRRRQREICLICRFWENEKSMTDKKSAANCRYAHTFAIYSVFSCALLTC